MLPLPFFRWLYYGLVVAGVYSHAPFWALPNEFLTGYSAAAGGALINSAGNLGSLSGSAAAVFFAAVWKTHRRDYLCCSPFFCYPQCWCCCCQTDHRSDCLKRKNMERSGDARRSDRALSPHPLLWVTDFRQQSLEAWVWADAVELRIRLHPYNQHEFLLSVLLLENFNTAVTVTQMSVNSGQT